MLKKIPQRTHYYFPVEGDSEQSFVKWLQNLSNQQNLHMHLDSQVLGGGGYRTMLEKAIHYRLQKQRQKAKHSILIVDADRSFIDDGWSHDQLREHAAKYNMEVCFQKPNIEGLLLRLFPGNNHLKSHSNAREKLCRIWPDYAKPMDAQSLASKFTLNDLLRAASADGDLKNLLLKIGLLG